MHENWHLGSLLSAISALLVLFSGCAAKDTPLAVTELVNHTQCQLVSAGVSQLSANQLPGVGGSRLLAAPGSASGPQVPADTQAIVAISRGQQPTPGYRFTLAHASLVNPDEVEIRLSWQQPAPDAVLAQMLTHPCIVLAVPATQTPLRRVRVADNNGPLGQLDI